MFHNRIGEIKHYIQCHDSILQAQKKIGKSRFTSPEIDRSSNRIQPIVSTSVSSLRDAPLSRM